MSERIGMVIHVVVLSTSDANASEGDRQQRFGLWMFMIFARACDTFGHRGEILVDFLGQVKTDIMRLTWVASQARVRTK